MSKAGWLWARGSPIFRMAHWPYQTWASITCTSVFAGWKTPHRFPERTPAAWMDTTEGWQWACAGRIGARDINLPGGVLHPTVSVGAYAQRKATATHSWVLAVDLAHNQSLRQFSETPLSMQQKLQLSSLAGVNLHFGHAQLMLLQGWVWTRPDEALGRVPFQAILAYAVRPSWAIEMGLRSFRIGPITRSSAYGTGLVHPAD